MRILALPLFLLVACASPSGDPGAIESDEAPAQMRLSARGQQLETVDGLKLVQENRRGALYVRPDHHLGAYDTIRIEPFTMNYRRGQRPLSEQQTKRLGKHLADSFRAQIESTYVGVEQTPGECTVSVQVHINDVELLDLVPSTGATSSFISSAGSVMMILEMRDSLTGRPLVRYGQRRLLPGGKVLGGPGALSTMGLGDALTTLFADVGTELVKIVPPTAGERESNCEGLLFEATAGSRVPASRSD